MRWSWLAAAAAAVSLLAAACTGPPTSPGSSVNPTQSPTVTSSGSPSTTPSTSPAPQCPPSSVTTVAPVPYTAAVFAASGCLLYVASRSTSSWSVGKLTLAGQWAPLGELPATWLTSIAVVAGTLWVAGTDPDGAALLAHATDAAGMAFTAVRLPGACHQVTALAGYGSGVLAAVSCSTGSLLLAATVEGTRQVAVTSVDVARLATRGQLWAGAGSRDLRPVVLTGTATSMRSSVLSTQNLQVRAVTYWGGTPVVGLVRLDAGGAPTAVQLMHPSLSGRWSTTPTGPPLTDLTSLAGTGPLLVACGGTDSGPSCLTLRDRAWHHAPFVMGETLLVLSAASDALWVVGEDAQIAPLSSL